MQAMQSVSVVFKRGECLHLWWGPWSSKPAGGLKKAVSGFDSHTLPLLSAVPLTEVIENNGRDKVAETYGILSAKPRSTSPPLLSSPASAILDPLVSLG